MSEPLTVFDDLLFDPAHVYINTNGQGGKFEQVSVEEIRVLAEDTKANLQLMHNRMSGLKVELEEAKELAMSTSTRCGSPRPYGQPNHSASHKSFGYRRNPFSRRFSHHSGIDFGGKTGDPVYATADGKVVGSSYDSALGHHIIIDHSNGIRTVYAHLSKREVSVGDRVKKGNTIGKLGSSGRSTGPHLHYEVYKNGVAVDPKQYLP